MKRFTNAKCFIEKKLKYAIKSNFRKFFKYKGNSQNVQSNLSRSLGIIENKSKIFACARENCNKKSQ